jgi:hypothetical protein
VQVVVSAAARREPGLLRKRVEFGVCELFHEMEVRVINQPAARDDRCGLQFRR